MCGPGDPQVCNYPVANDAGIDAGVACVCQPHGEDVEMYDCASYDQCMNGSGTVDSSVKSCSSDTDCTIQPEQTDCCGSLLFVGVAAMSAQQFQVCEVAWAEQYPKCACAAFGKTEDGKATNISGNQVQVHCVANLCATSTP